MKKINLSEFLFVLEYHTKKSPITVESKYLKSLMTDDNGYVGFAGELYTDGNNIYTRDEHDHKSMLHVCDIDFSEYK